MDLEDLEAVHRTLRGNLRQLLLPSRSPCCLSGVNLEKAQSIIQRFSRSASNRTSSRSNAGGYLCDPCPCLPLWQNRDLACGTLWA